MAQRRPWIKQKRLIFLAGEGKSERGYGRWLNKLAFERNLPIAFTVDALRGGDPLDLVEQAVARIRSMRGRRGPFAVRGLLLDADLRGRALNRDAQALRVADQLNLRLIWQDPIHEAFLLRHFEGFQSHCPPNEREATTLLKGMWPTYRKGMDGTEYGRVLTQAHLARARMAEPDLDQFLKAAGWQ